LPRFTGQTKQCELSGLVNSVAEGDYSLFVKNGQRVVPARFRGFATCLPGMSGRQLCSS